MVTRFSRWLPWWPSWILERNGFSSSKFPCCPNGFRQVSAQSVFPFWSRYQLKIFTMAAVAANLGSRNKIILAILNLHVTPVPPNKFWLILTYHSEAAVVSRFSIWPPWLPSWISEQNGLSQSEFLCCSDASLQVSAPSNLRLERRCRLKNFKMVIVAVILDIGTERF